MKCYNWIRLSTTTAILINSFHVNISSNILLRRRGHMLMALAFSPTTKTTTTSAALIQNYIKYKNQNQYHQHQCHYEKHNMSLLLSHSSFCSIPLVKNSRGVVKASRSTFHSCSSSKTNKQRIKKDSIRMQLSQGGGQHDRGHHWGLFRLRSSAVDDNSPCIDDPLADDAVAAAGQAFYNPEDRDEDWFVTGNDENDDDEKDDNVEEEVDANHDNDKQTTSTNKPTTNHHHHRYMTILASIEKAIQNHQKKKDALQRELDKAKSLEDTLKRANLIVSNLYQLPPPPGTKSIIVQDWDVEGEVQDVELVLSDEYATAQEEADALFAAARKMKRGSAVVGELIVETENSLRFLEEAKGDLEHVFGRVSSSSGGGDDGDDGGDANVNVEDYLSMILHRLERSSKQTGFYLLPLSNNQESSNKHNQHPKKQSSPQSSQQHTCRKFHSPGGCIVLVGRNRRDNESICFQISKANDIWMHARGCPGAHVLIQVRRGSPKPTDQCLQYAANLAAFYSEFRTERKVDVTSASPKHLLKPRGAPLGAVKIRQEMNTWTGYPMDVEEELKVARERSGLVSSWDESTGLRSFGGKAKNRKRTTENVKQLVAKKRAEKRAKKKRRQGGGGGGDESSNQNEM